MILRRDDLDGVHQSGQITTAVVDAAVQGIAEKVVHSIGIDLPRDELSPEQGTAGARVAFDQIGNLVRRQAIVLVQRMIFDHVLQHSADNGGGVILMLISGISVLTSREKLLGGVGERRMADVVQQGRHSNNDSIALQAIVVVPQLGLEGLPRSFPDRLVHQIRDVSDAKGVFKPGVHRAGIGVRPCELPNPGESWNAG